MRIFIIVPFYNEKKHIADVAKRLSIYKVPIVFVDDGSTDNYEVGIKNLKLKNMTLIKHEINLGKGAAMKTGAEFAFKNGADAVIFMDGDNQHDSKDVLKFFDVFKIGDADVVLGTRNYNNGVPLIRYLGNKFASLVLHMLFGIYVSDVLCGFKALTKKAYKKIKWESSGYGVETEMIARMGKEKISFCEVPVQSIYHDKVKGVTMLDAFGIMGEIIKWRFTI